MQSENKLKVAVYMITYNHEPFIAKSIESVLMQETNFNFHLFIGEDGSEDNTAEICRQYADRYPDKITLFSDGINRGATANAAIVFKACFESNADYVAILEGDDYWIEKRKLQLQADFLDINKDYVIHGGNAKMVDYQDSIIDREISESANHSKSFELIDFADKSRVITLTAMFKNIEIPVDSTYKKCPFPDYYIWTYLIKKTDGKVYYDFRLLGVYRQHTRGIYSGLNSTSIINGTIKTLEVIEKTVADKFFTANSITTLSKLNFRLFKIYLANKLHKKAILAALKGIKYRKGRFGIKDYLVVIKDYYLHNKFELLGEY